jgi:multimeric flavodoxin WrbA
MIKAVGICGSRTIAGSTEQLIKRCLQRLHRNGIEIKFISLVWKTVYPCAHCGGCRVERNGTCSVEGDDFTPLFKSVHEADIILIGAPVDLGSAPSALKHFLERSLQVSRTGGNLLSRKIGSPIPVLAKEVSRHSLLGLTGWFPSQGVIVPGAASLPVTRGAPQLAISLDEEGESVVDELADNLAWLARKVFPEQVNAHPVRRLG